MTVGFFGKVRSHGDFVSRRLPSEMLLPFDAWIQASLVQCRRELGAGWMATWSNSPLWRFVLAPGLCGPQAWTGVMMPSADRVGRCFPLVLALGMAQAPAWPDCCVQHAAWYAQLEQIALSSIDPPFSFAVFDAAMQLADDVPHLAGAAAPWTAGAGLAGRSAWWTEGSDQVAPCIAMCDGLPATGGVVALLDGKWGQRGWLAVQDGAQVTTWLASPPPASGCDADGVKN